MPALLICSIHTKPLHAQTDRTATDEPFAAAGYSLVGVRSRGESIIEELQSLFVDAAGLVQKSGPFHCEYVRLWVHCVRFFWS